MVFILLCISDYENRATLLLSSPIRRNITVSLL
nr:MAG TPA: hypothetical protein [Caudoviricetes sp.]